MWITDAAFACRPFLGPAVLCFFDKTLKQVEAEGALGVGWRKYPWICTTLFQLLGLATGISMRSSNDEEGF